MDRVSVEVAGFSVPEYLTWDELLQLPDHIADEIELWERRVFWNRRGPFAHQRFVSRMHNAIESAARRAMANATSQGDMRCWEVGFMTDVFFKSDKSSVLTPDFMVRRCMPGYADTNASDVVLVGEVLLGSDTHRRRLWKMDRYAESGIPWYWEVEVDTADSWDINAVRAYELGVIPTAGLKVKPLRPAVYIPAGEWEPTDSAGIDFPEPFAMNISWDDLAY